MFIIFVCVQKLNNVCLSYSMHNFNNGYVCTTLRWEFMLLLIKRSTLTFYIISFWSCICKFALIVFIYFNMKFCSKLVLFYINYSWLSPLGQAPLLCGEDLRFFRSVTISTGWNRVQRFLVISLLNFKLKSVNYSALHR